MKKPNNLINETSPYLLQHAYNPVNWYPWSSEAFDRATKENKPIFLSIGYSTCHWCHVMENESFEDEEVARKLNENFISIKVDKEERPDVDSIYMNVCQAMTRSGGWPLTIFMTPEKKPFFSGTYFPKHSSFNMTGFLDLLSRINTIWNEDKSDLENHAAKITNFIKDNTQNNTASKNCYTKEQIIENAFNSFSNTFDKKYGGFGDAPKFPMPHNLLFLLEYYKLTNNELSLEMVNKTLLQMFKGGIFDHIGFGFSRYSTDNKWLVPHFEKMLYDNSLLIMAYTKAYEINGKSIYKDIAEKTIQYILCELTSEEGGFYCAQDADSDGIEGKYYVFDQSETIHVLGEKEGQEFNKLYDITQKGNFEGNNIPNIINHYAINDNSMDVNIKKMYEYRKNRMSLHKDDKILTSWNGLTIAAFSRAYAAFNDKEYLAAAKKSVSFIEKNIEENKGLYTSYREGKISRNVFIDDYAFFIFGLIELYNVTLDKQYLDKSLNLLFEAKEEFWDDTMGGFYLYGKSSEQLLIRPKETYDGAIPSGNSVMVYNLLMLSKITKENSLEDLFNNQLDFMIEHAKDYPQGHSFFIKTLVLYYNPPKEIVCILKNKKDLENAITDISKNSIVTIYENETSEYRLVNDMTTFYVCEGNRCLAPTNDLISIMNE